MPRKPRPKRKRNKGTPYERELCWAFSRWWAEDEGIEEVLFWRTAGSGARATTRGRKGFKTNAAHCGDIGALGAVGAPLTGLIAIEIKRGYGATNNRASMHDLMDKPRDLMKQEGIEEWIEQAKRSAENADAKYWMIVHRRDNRDALVYFDGALYDALTEDNIRKRFKAPIQLSWCWVRTKNGEKIQAFFAVVRLDEFLRAIRPQEIMKLYLAHLAETKHAAG